METTAKILKGENLELYRNIQDSIQKIRQATRGSNPVQREELFEEILPERSNSERVTRGGSHESSKTPPERADTGMQDSDQIAMQWPRKNERELLGAAFLPTTVRGSSRNNDLKELKSDWMLDELRCDCRVKNSLPLSNAYDSFTTGSSIKKQELKKERAMNMRLYDRMTPEEENQMFEEICERYGNESGRRFLLVRSMTTPEPSIEPWTTFKREPASKEKSHIYNHAVKKCLSNQKQTVEYTCPEISRSVHKKMQTLVDILPKCDTQRMTDRKNWKGILRGSTKLKKEVKIFLNTESPSSELSSMAASSQTVCKCGKPNCDCAITRSKCDIPKVTKKCHLIDHNIDETNNYLITCRENLQNKQVQNRRVTVLQNHAVKVAKRVTRESTYLQSAHEQTAQELVTCLMKVMPPQGQEVSDIGFNYVEDLANALTAHKMIDDHEWRAWRYQQQKMDNVEDSDEADSFDSDIISTSEDSDEMFSECDIHFTRDIPQSRIPYFKETYQLANLFFNKIGAKLDKIIHKNHNKKQVMMRRPISFLLRQRLQLVRSKSKMFNQIFQKIAADDYYSKYFTPHTERKYRKCKKVIAKKAELAIKQIRRKLTEGIQLGKQYRRVRKSHLFTKRENYSGFNHYRQTLLNMEGLEKFKKCNLVDKRPNDKALDRKVIHKDYRFIRRLFDHQNKKKREDLFDPGMKARLKEYMDTLHNRKEPPETEEEEGSLNEEVPDDEIILEPKTPKKEEQKIQTASPRSTDRWSYCSHSSGNAAEAFTSMEGLLRRGAKYRKGFDSGQTADPSTPKQAAYSAFTVSRSPTYTSFGRTSLYSDGDFEPRVGQRNVEKLKQGSRSKTRHTSTINPVKRGKTGSLFTSESLTSFDISGLDSLSQITTLKKNDTKKKSAMAKSAKTLPPIHSNRPDDSQHQKRYQWKSSKTVR